MELRLFFRAVAVVSNETGECGRFLVSWRTTSVSEGIGATADDDDDAGIDTEEEDAGASLD